MQTSVNALLATMSGAGLFSLWLLPHLACGALPPTLTWLWRKRFRLSLRDCFWIIAAIGGVCLLIADAARVFYDPLMTTPHTFSTGSSLVLRCWSDQCAITCAGVLAVSIGLTWRFSGQRPCP
jgi:hypothetical protein